MMIKRNHFMLMSAFGTLASAGAAALNAIETDVKKAVTYVEGKLHLRHTETGQEVSFDDQGQRDHYLANVADPHNWADPTASNDVETAPAAPMGLSQIVGDDGTADRNVTGAAPVQHVNVDLDQLRTGAAPADAITVIEAATDASAPAVDGAVTTSSADQAVTETPAA